MSVTPAEIIKFWFDEIDSTLWFKKDDQFDQELKARFSVIHQSAAQSELFDWRTDAEGRLAEIIVLDQFSRNFYRDSAAAFASDPLSLALAQEAVALGLDQQLAPQKRVFLYMPYMHSESVKVHEVALQLFTDLGRENNLDYELRHKAIIERFGRYPHRNKLLGRQSSPEEIEFLTQPGSSF